MTAGMAFEALNHAGHLRAANLLVVLNDNEMSIEPNVGALSPSCRASCRRRWRGACRAGPGTCCRPCRGACSSWRGAPRNRSRPCSRRAALRGARLPLRRAGVRARPDGAARDLRATRAACSHTARDRCWSTRITRKGHGYAPAEQDPLKYHGVTPFDVATGQMPKPAAPAAVLHQRLRRHPARSSRRRTSASSRSPPRWPAARGFDRFAGRIAGALLRRRHRRTARRDLRRRPGHRGPQAGRARSTRPSCSAPSTRSSTTSACRTWTSPSRSTAPGWSAPTARPTRGSTTSPTCAACPTWC